MCAYVVTARHTWHLMVTHTHPHSHTTVSQWTLWRSGLCTTNHGGLHSTHAHLSMSILRSRVEQVGRQAHLLTAPLGGRACCGGGTSTTCLLPVSSISTQQLQQQQQQRPKQPIQGGKGPPSHAGQEERCGREGIGDDDGPPAHTHIHVWTQQQHHAQGQGAQPYARGNHTPQPRQATTYTQTTMAVNSSDSLGAATHLQATTITTAPPANRSSMHTGTPGQKPVHAISAAGRPMQGIAACGLPCLSVTDRVSSLCRLLFSSLPRAPQLMLPNGQLCKVSTANNQTHNVSG